MSGKNSGFDFADLEKEIDSAVDLLLVKKKEKTNPAAVSQSHPPNNHLQFERAATPDRAAVHPATQSQARPSKVPPSFENKDIVKSPSSPASMAQTTTSLSRELQEKLEEVEAQLLTLEWDLNAKHINNAITHLQDLRKYTHLGNELEKVIILIQKVLYQLILDESKLTPAALKFLQKSWKAVKGMTDKRFSLEIDKETLVSELLAEFQKLRIEEKVTKEQTKVIDDRRSLEGTLMREEARVSERPLMNERVSFTEIDTFMSKLEKLMHVLNEEQKRWESIHQEIINVKADLQRKLRSIPETRGQKLGEEKIELGEVIEGASAQPANFESRQAVGAPLIAVSLFQVSGVVFALPEKQIIRSFPIKKWVSDSFIERGKVKLKNREIPLFNICQVFKLKPSTEENPLVILIKGREDHPAAVIIDKAISREEMEYQLIEGRPYIWGQGISRRGRVWILNVEQISP
jgi:hypothetical protein